MNDLRKTLDKYLRDTQVFIQYLEKIMSDIDIKATQIERDREQIVRDRAELISRSNSLLGQVNSMRLDRDQAQQKAKEAEKIKQIAKDEMIKVQILIENTKNREKELEEREAKMKTLESRERALEMGEKQTNEIEKIRESLQIKENFIKHEQDLLYEKQKSLEIREAHISKDEERIKRLHGQM